VQNPAPSPLSGLAQAAAAVQPTQPAAPPPAPRAPGIGGSLDPGIMTLLMKLLGGQAPQPQPTLGSLIRGG
jgi:hypothetical protein